MESEHLTKLSHGRLLLDGDNPVIHANQSPKSTLHVFRFLGLNFKICWYYNKSLIIFTFIEYSYFKNAQLLSYLKAFLK